MMTDKNLQEAINEAFEQSTRQTGTLKLRTLKYLDELRKEQLRRAKCEE